MSLDAHYNDLDFNSKMDAMYPLTPEECYEPEASDKEADNCVRCGGPIDHNDPHFYCSNCT